MQMMYKLDQHTSCDKVTAHTDLHTEKDVDLIAINLRIWKGRRFENTLKFYPDLR